MADGRPATAAGFVRCGGSAVLYRHGRWSHRGCDITVKQGLLIERKDGELRLVRSIWRRGVVSSRDMEVGSRHLLGFSRD